jgi:hypothetical protein
MKINDIWHHGHLHSFSNLTTWKKNYKKTACQNSENCHSSVHFIFFTNRRIMIGKFSCRSYTTHIRGNVKNTHLISSNSILLLCKKQRVMQSSSVQSTHIVSPYGYITAVAIPADLTYSLIYNASVIASRILYIDCFYCR